MHRQLNVSLFSQVLSEARNARSVFGFGAFLLLANLSFAQVDRSGLNGVVTDSSGRSLGETHITAMQNSTRLHREAVTSSNGTYDIPELPVGVYSVTFEHAGFTTLKYVDVQQVIGQTRTLDAALRVAGGAEHVQVTASSQLIDKTSNALGGVIENKQARELPLNGRNWATLTSLVPGAVDTGGSNQRSVRFAGRGRDDDNFTYDGIDATNIVNQPQQPYVRLAIPLDSIEEFRIDSMMATAESGGTGGPQLAVTSPSGTTQWHGRAFEFVRNNVFDAMQPVPVTSGTIPPLRLNQFGGSIGGAVLHDKTFLYLAYEGYRQNWGFPLLGYVPSSAFRTSTLSVSPSLGPIVNAYPLGQTATSDPNVDLFASEGTQVVNENSGMVRLDQHFSDRTTGFARLNFDRAVNTQPLADSSGNYLRDQQQLTSAPVNGILDLLHTFRSNLVNDFKFGYNRGTADTYDLNQSGIPYAVSVAGFTGLNNDRVSTGVGNSFSEVDNLTWIKGRHAVKAGVEIRRVQMNQGKTESGTITFSSTTALAANEVSTAKLTGTLPENGLRKTEFFGYVQDEYKWSQNLALNLGLRYSFFNLFHEVLGRANPFDFATCGPQGFCGIGASFGQPNYVDIDPRVAVAWSPDKGGKTVVRAGFGMYHEDGQLDDQNLPISNEVYSYSLSNKKIPNLSYPITPYLSDTTGIISPQDDDRTRKDTYVEQWGLSVQRALPADMVGTLSYVGSTGVHLLTISDVNVFDPVTGLQTYPSFGIVSWRGNRDNSSYEGFSASLKRSFSHGLLFSANYMWSHEIDDGSDGSGDGDSLVPQNVACAACERASGIWDVRHVLNANAVYELPFGRNKPFLSQPGPLRAIAGSWELSSMALARTGFPVNVLVNRSAASVPDGNTADQRPDLVPGVSLTPPGGRKIGNWINTAAFATPASGTFGNAPRDVATGPGAWQMDVGMNKQIIKSEKAELQFRSEFFNLFNHPQYGSPQSTYGVQGFGQIAATVNTLTPVSPVGSGTPREMQFALRFQF